MPKPFQNWMRLDRIMGELCLHYSYNPNYSRLANNNMFIKFKSDSVNELMFAYRCAHQKHVTGDVYKK